MKRGLGEDAILPPLALWLASLRVATWIAEVGIQGFESWADTGEMGFAPITAFSGPPIPKRHNGHLVLACEGCAGARPVQSGNPTAGKHGDP